MANGGANGCNFWERYAIMGINIAIRWLVIIVPVAALIELIIASEKKEWFWFGFWTIAEAGLYVVHIMYIRKIHLIEKNKHPIQPI